MILTIEEVFHPSKIVMAKREAWRKAQIATGMAVPCHTIHCRHYGLAHGKPCIVEAQRILERAALRATIEHTIAK